MRVLVCVCVCVCVCVRACERVCVRVCVCALVRNGMYERVLSQASVTWRCQLMLHSLAEHLEQHAGYCKRARVSSFVYKGMHV